MARKQKKVKSNLPIYYPDRVDMTEVAAIVLDRLEEAFIETPSLALNFAGLEQLDPVEFGQELITIFTPEDINELMGTKHGPGIILGAYLMKAWQHELAEAAEVDV